MVPYRLLLLHCDDGIDWTSEIYHYYSPLMTTRSTNLDSLAFPLKPSVVSSLTKCKNCILLITPDLLKLIELKPKDLLKLTDLLNPLATVAALCCGVTAGDLTRYHKMALSSFQKWSVVELDDTQDFCRFVQCNLNPLISDYNKVKIDDTPKVPVSPSVVIIPRRVTKEENTVYVISDKYMERTQPIHIILEKNAITSNIRGTFINPFVLNFSVPDSFLVTTDDIHVSVHIEDKIIAESKLECVVEIVKIRLENTGNDDDDVDSIIYDDSAENTNSLSVENTMDDINCENCVFDEIEVFDGAYSNDFENIDSAIKDMDNSYEKLKEDDYIGIGRLESIPRSVSLPSLTSPQESSKSFINPLLLDGESNDDICYLDMTGTINEKRRALKPHEQFIENMFERQYSHKYEQFENIICNHYVTMKRDQRHSNKGTRELSTSQQELVELMQGFKRGLKTISEVEQLFQDWHQRHSDSIRDKEILLLKQKYGKLQRNQSSFRLKNILSRKTKRKISKVKTKDGEEELFQNQAESKLERKLKSLSKISNSSNSSGCSASSELSVTIPSSEKMADSGNVSDAVYSIQKKIIPNSNVPSIRRPDVQSTIWFHPLKSSKSQSTSCILSPDEAPACLLPTRPPPHVVIEKQPSTKKNKKTPKKPARKLPIPPLPSPDYIIPNDHLYRQTGDVITSYMKIVPQPPKKVSMPNIHCRKTEAREFRVNVLRPLPPLPMKTLKPHPKLNRLRSHSHSEIYENPIYLDLH